MFKKYLGHLKRVAAILRKIENIEAVIRKEQSVFYFDRQAYESQENGTSNEMICNSEILVSLTSHGSRINEVHLAIESIMRQTIMPNRIVLWLGKQFETQDVPILLQRQQKRGLEINYFEDIGPHTKLIPSLMKYPDSVIITIDDDMIYPSNFIEGLVKSYKSDSSKIYFYRGHRILFNSRTKLAS